MKLLCLSDIHCEFNNFPPRSLPDADLCLVAGDLTHTGFRHERQRHEVQRAYDWLQALSRRFPVFWIPGNHDLEVTCDTWSAPDCHCLLRRSQTFRGVTFYGESLSTAFDIPELATYWAYTTANAEDDAYAWENAPAAQVIVSHCPPFGIQDAAGRLWDAAKQKMGPVRYIGSPGLRDYIDRHRPRLVVCGHIHESAGETIYGETRVINTAQRATLVELEETSW